jgi:hypothetical protein
MSIIDWASTGSKGYSKQYLEFQLYFGFDIGLRVVKISHSKHGAVE